MGRKIKEALFLAVILIALTLGLIIANEQYEQIYNYCLGHPQTYLKGELEVNCTEFLVVAEHHMSIIENFCNQPTQTIC